MGSPISQNLLEQGLNFLGRETARQTHEITNVHNIINELSGLLGDMLAAAAGGQGLDPERVGKIVTKIQEQIQRGNNLVRGLNRFAHSVDVLTGMFDLEEVAERVEFLAERHARLGKVRLKCLPPPKNVSFDGFLLGYQQLILDALDLILESDGRSNEVCIGYQIADGVMEFYVESDQPRVKNDLTIERIKQIEALIAELGGRLNVPGEEGVLQRVVLSFPHLQAGGG
jgi:hypothetical protein